MSELLRVFDRYEILRHLTTGGMGDIFLARQVGVAGFERLVILKSLRPELVEDDAQLAQFLNEARVVAQLNHPNIVAVLEVDEYRGVYFIAMEYIAGVDLAALLRAAMRARQRIPYRVSAGVILDAARGLAHAHRLVDADGRPAPLVHRDVSPQNVMVRADGIAKVLDFGIATVAGHVPDGGRIQGKVRYMAPEQLLGRATGPVSDQFALGVTLWELCTQRRLFAEPDLTAIVRRMIAGPLPAPSSVQPDVPPALDAIVSRMITIEPARRFPETTDVVDALRAFVDESGGPAERAIERFVGVLAGAEIAARTRGLAPTPVEIPGLLPTTEVTCAACQQTNQRRHRFCARCGAPLVVDEPLPAPTPAPRRVAPELGAGTRTIARPSIHTLLFEEANALRARQAPPVAPTPTLVVTLTLGARERIVAERGEAAARHADRQVLDRVAALAESFDARTLLLRPTEAVLALPSEGDTSGGVAARRALRLAAELGAELARDALAHGVERPSLLVITRPPLELSAPPAARRQAAEALLAELRAIDPRGAGILVARPLTAELHDAARFGEVLEDLQRVEHLLGDAPAGGQALVGRREELAEIRAALAAARAGEPRALVWVGEPGIGKTRLLAEGTATAAKRGFVLATVRAGAGSVGAQLLAALQADAPDDARAALAQVRALTARRPLWIAIDDASRDDEPLHAAIATLLEGAGACLVVCATSTPADAPAWAAPRALAPLADDRVLAIAQGFADERPMPPAVVQPLLEHARGNPGRAEALVRAIVAADGMRRDEARWIATPNLARFDPTDATAALDAATHRAAGPFGARALDALALAGEPLAADVALGCAGDLQGDTHDHPRAARAAALTAQLLALRAVRHDPAGLVIEPGLARNLLRALEADDARRAATHEALGRATLQALPDDARAGERALRAARDLIAGEARQDAIALVLTLAREPALAARVGPVLRAALEALTVRLQTLEPATPTLVEATIRAGRAAIAAWAREDYAGASAIVDTLTPLPQPDTMRHVWLLARAELSLTEGRLDDARRALAEAAPLAHDAHARAEAAACWAEVHEAAGELTDAIDRATQALEHAGGAAPSPDFTWRQSNMLGRLHLRAGDAARAEHLFGLAHAAATEVGSPRGRALASINRATIAARAGRLADAELQLAEAATDAEAAGEVGALARALHNRGRILAELGRVAEARVTLERSLRHAREAAWAEGEALSRQALDGLARRAD